MSWWWTEKLRLAIDNKCADSRRCSCNPRPSDIKVTKDDAVDEAIGFSRYNHELRNGKTFILEEQLSENEIVTGSNGIGKNVYDVTTVSIYYWKKDENRENPLLIEVTKQNTEREYYYKHAGEPGRNARQWAQNKEHHDLQQRLDDRNCAINRATVVDIKDPESTSRIDKSDCRSKTKRIVHASKNPTLPPGGDYIVKEYDITGHAKISRVTFNGSPTNIDLDTTEFTKIRVYYWEADDIGIPLLVEFKPSALRGTSIWFENTHKGSTQWEDVNNTDGFYDTEDPSKPTWRLTTKLDQVNCTVDNVVQIDVSKTPRDGTGSYCHGTSNKHTSMRISVTDTSQGKLCLYRSLEHKFESGSPFNISSFKNGDKYIKQGDLPTPLRGVNKVVVYFCRENVEKSPADNPLLIYIDSINLPEINQWLQSKDGGDSWQTVEYPPQNENKHEKIVEILDNLTSKCKPPEVTININERGPDYKDTSGSNKMIDVIKNNRLENASDFVEYRHTVHERSGTYFTINSFTYKDENTRGFQTPIYKVGSVSVFYWTQLEDGRSQDQRGRPLLIKVIIKNVTNDQTTNIWYENVGTSGDKNWNKATGDQSSNLEKKLKLLNCRLNNAVVIDIKRPLGDYDKCDDVSDKEKWDPGHGKRMIVENDGSYSTTIKHYNVYDHKLKANHGDKFHIVDFEGGIPQSLDNTSILDVSAIKVYLCGGKPLLVYYKQDSGTEGGVIHNWFKKDDSWEKESTTLSKTHDHTSYEEVLKVLDGLKSDCGPPSVTIDISQKTGARDSCTYDDTGAEPSKQIIKVTKGGGKPNKDPPEYFDRYDHTVEGREETYFTLSGLVYNKDTRLQNKIQKITREDDVTLVSVYYWKHGDVGGKPLLVKVTKAKKKSNPKDTTDTWYENTGEDPANNTEWIPVTEPNDLSSSNGKLKNKLDLLNCRLNNVVIVDASKRTSGESYCHDDIKDKLDSGHPSKLQIEEESSSIGKDLATYKAYAHSLNTSIGKFHVVCIKSPDKSNITLKGGAGKGTEANPLKNVQKLIFYFCPNSPTYPLLIYYQTTSGPPEHNWYKFDNVSSTWTSLAGDLCGQGPNGNSEKIIDELDKIGNARNPCRPTEVTIDIKHGPDDRTSYYDSGSKKINVTKQPVENATGYTGYKHEPNKRGREYFTVVKIDYNGRNTSGFKPNANIKKVTELSVFYWNPLKDKGKPLLIKVSTQDSGYSTMYYENEGINNKWKPVEEFTSISPTTTQLKAKLILLNCKLNNVTVIDIGKKPSDPSYCHEPNDEVGEDLHEPKLIKVEDVTNNLYKKELGKFVVYEHAIDPSVSRLRSHLGSKFHISGFKNNNTNIKLNGKSSPIPALNVTKFLVYYCDKDETKGKPLLIHFKRSTTPEGQATEQEWYKKDGETDWKEVVGQERPKSETDTDSIYSILNSYPTKCKSWVKEIVITTVSVAGGSGVIGGASYTTYWYFFLRDPWVRLM